MDLSNPLSSLLANNDVRVIRVLSRVEAPISGRQVHAIAGEGSYSGIRLSLERLSASGLVTAVVSPSATNYSINREHLLWKPVLDILQSRSRLFVDMSELLSGLSGIESADQTLSLGVYGSVARGDSDESSDIDIVVIYENDDQRSLEARNVETLLEAIEKWTSNSVQLYDATREELGQMVRANDPIVASWLADSVPVAGPTLASLIAAESK